MSAREIGVGGEEQNPEGNGRRSNGCHD
jgi:hypothetical protein